MYRDIFEELFDYEKIYIICDCELLKFSKYIINHKDEIPSLFRFSVADYNNIRNLETQSLFLSPTGSLNDIFEGLSCPIDDKVIDNLDKLNDIAYIKSFSEDNKNLLMWAHYADSYSGMCVEYDFSKLSDNILYHLFPIYYSEKKLLNISLERTIKELNDLKISNVEHVFPVDSKYLTDIMSAFLIKSKEWEYEKEWRIIATYPHIHNYFGDIEENENAKNLYEIKNQYISVKSCIKSVYLGPKMKQRIKDHIKEICKNKLNNIPVYEARISKEKYEIEFVQVLD